MNGLDTLLRESAKQEREERNANTSKFTEKQLKRLRDVGGRPRWWHVSSSWQEDPHTGRMVQIGGPATFSQIEDTATGEFYPAASVPIPFDERAALDAALDVAERSAKPLTPAQKADIASGRARNLEAENLQLRARLAELGVEIDKDKTA